MKWIAIVLIVMSAAVIPFLIVTASEPKGGHFENIIAAAIGGMSV
jgi:hypothetical protein